MTKRRSPDEVPAEASPAHQGEALARKPMARATRISLFEREVRERLSRAALDLVLARAERLSEGQRSGAAGGDPAADGAAGTAGTAGKGGYVGSTMLTIDLSAMKDVLRDACDASTARQLVALMGADAGIPGRIRDIAEQEASRLAAAKLKDLRTHVSIRAQGAKVFIDVDVEAGVTKWEP